MGDQKAVDLRQQLSRRNLLVAGGAGLAATSMLATPAFGARAPAATIAVVEGGSPRAIVVTDSTASETVQAAAAELVSYVAQSTGVTLPTAVVPDDGSLPDDLNKIYVGLTGPGAHPMARRRTGNAGHDGFRILPYGDTITILGSPDSPDLGTVNGVRDFLERHVGVAWLMPTSIGEDVPAQDAIHVPARPVLEEPAFGQRVFSPLARNTAGPAGPYPEHYEWARRNRLQASGGAGSPDYYIQFHHNLYSLFPVEEFGETHPEFYPNGNPPPPGRHAGWQPVFSEPGTITVAVEKIKQFFQENPDAQSFSLGVNDSGGFAEVDPVEPYYNWVNAVVEQVTAEYPDKWFGLLAYQQIEEPPPFDLHPRVVPFFTQDRLAWADSDAKAATQDLLAIWGEVASQIGFYDYIYGTPYVVPRVYPHLAAETYAYARDIGVVAHYAELYPNWGEGPKPWLRAKLLWDPDRDVDALLAEWYERAVGSAAAPYLRQYYELWEEFWTNRVPQTEWFKPTVTFQAFGDASYLEAVTEADVSQSRELIDQVVGLAGTEQQQARAEMLARAYEYYEASILSYPRESPAPADAQEALSLLENIESTWQEKKESAERRLQLFEEFEDDPLLVHPLKPSALGLLWGGWNKSEFWGLADYLRDNEPDGGPVTTWLESRVAAEPSEFVQFVTMLLGLQGGTLTTLTANSSFEEGMGQPPGWSLWIARLGENARFNVQEGVAHSGQASLYARAIGRGGPNQVVPVTPGLIATRAHVYAPAGTDWHGTVGISVNLRSQTGAQIGVIRGPVIPVADRAGEWFTVDTLDVIPESIDGQAVVRAQYVLIIDGFDSDPAFFHMDDIVVYQAPQE